MDSYKSFSFWDAKPVNGFLVKIRISKRPENWDELPMLSDNKIKAGDKLFVWDHALLWGMVYECCFVKGI
ncbi:hypothetical protein [Methanobacterium paludis]|uniref:Uncharacterized protein n=1 Tax=Methanobacterium paludis (strain DSM 25820 / JCM 18151 / SWAN1) TaxID=868131 RepID=F6D3A2_METPW|nr:hypothetical protein [Methanobacterium paludis]AEG18694.1 hypothetical protein MSWAN_1683 [Methanobacterium paludis]